MKTKLFINIVLTINVFIAMIYPQTDSLSFLSRYDLDSKENITIKLPKGLKEISGLAFAGDNKIFAHDDEIGKVFKLDLKSGKVIKKFDVGEKKIKKDFEGIAVAREYIYLVNSSGTLYKFPEGRNEEEVAFEKIPTGLKEENDIEGLCYDPVTNSLLLACKGKAGKELEGCKAVYSFNINDMSLDEHPRFLISLEELKEDYGIKDFSPSGIEKHPANGSFFIISANPEAVIELSPEGKILNAKKLDKKKHKQPEGITFNNNSDLIISDEGDEKRAKITIIELSD